MKYTVVLKGAPPLDLARKISEAHVKAIASGSHSTTEHSPTNHKLAGGSP